MTTNKNYDTTGNVAVVLNSGTLYVRTHVKGDKIGAIVQDVLGDMADDTSPERFAGALLQGIAGHNGAEIALEAMESTNPTIVVDLLSDEISVADYCTLGRVEFCEHFSNAKMMQKFHPERLQKRGRKPRELDNASEE